MGTRLQGSGQEPKKAETRKDAEIMSMFMKNDDDDDDDSDDVYYYDDDDDDDYY